jgi:hypothetical protein
VKVRDVANFGFRVRLPGDAFGSWKNCGPTGRPWPTEDVHQLTRAPASQS